MSDLMTQYIVNNAFAKLLGFDFSVIEKGAVLYRVKIDNSHLATPGFAHGGLISSLLDAAMGVGALTVVENDFKVVSTIGLQINFLKAAKMGDDLTAESKLIRAGKKVIFMKGEVRNSRNELIAIGNASFYPFNAEKAGYILNK